MRINRHFITAAAASLIAMGSLGCTTVSNKSQSTKSASSERSLIDRLPWIGDKEKEVPEPYPNPAKIAATWTPDTLVQTGRTPTRGFGGRVFFYDEKSRPVPVDGSLIVHGFDDNAPDAASRVKRFEFTPEQFTRHFSQTDLGASYSVWIPWDAVGGEQRRISLVTSFRTAEGKLVQGIPATVLLPGKSPQLNTEQQIAKLSPQYLKYREAASQGSSRTSGLTTTTIPRRSSGNLSAPMNQQPGITIPGTQKSDMVAGTNGTPSLDLEMSKRPSRPNVMPASAQMPLQR